MPDDAQEKPISGEHLTGADYARYVMDEDTEITLTSAGEEIGELRDENERLKERIAELEAAIKPLSHYDVDAAREAAHSAREQGLAEVADFLDNACDDITEALLGFFDAEAEVPP